MGIGESKSTQTERRPRRMVQSYIVAWLDANTNKNNADYKYTMTQLYQIFTTVNTFTKVDECVEFIQTNTSKQIFVISSGSLGETTVPRIHDIEHINAIFIFCRNKSQHDQWAQHWPKVKGVFTSIIPISSALKKAVYQYEQNTISMSFLPTNDDGTNKDLDEINQSFMYTQVLEEILLTIDFKRKHLTELVNYCREEFKDNPRDLKNIEKVKNEYFKHSAVWWYTYDCFLYSSLNCALRSMEIDLIIKFGIFLSSIHKFIVKLHSQQYTTTQQVQPFIVYRGQGLSCQDFEQLERSKGGLLSFNSFLSTSEDRTTALDFARKNAKNPKLLGIMFVMKINPRIKSTPFANISKHSYYKREKEILFSMHSIFRINEIKKLDGYDRIWQVHLTLTAENDPQLQTLTEHIRRLTYPEMHGWHRLGNLLYHLNQYDGARHVYEALLREANDNQQKRDIYMQLGSIHRIQRNFKEATDCFEKALTICERLFQTNNADSASSQRSIGVMYENMGEYTKALSSYEAVIAICDDEDTNTNNVLLAASYSDIGDIYKKRHEYSKALSYYEKALELKQKTISQNHSLLAPFHCNLGLIHNQMKEYSKALTHLEIALTITQDILPHDHPDLAYYHHEIGNVYFSMKDYSKALSHFENAARIKRKFLPSNHLSIADIYFNIGQTFFNLNEYTNAISYHEKVLKIRQKILGADHCSLVNQYNTMAKINEEMKDYSKALSFYEKAVEIEKKSTPSNDILLYKLYKTISKLYEKMGDSSNAFVYQKKASDIRNEMTNIDKEMIDMEENFMHDLLLLFNIFSREKKKRTVSDNKKVYLEQLSDAERQLQIDKRNPDVSPARLIVHYSEISSAHYQMGNFSEALSYCATAIEMKLKARPCNLSSLAQSYSWASCIFNQMADYSQAYLFRQKAIETTKENLVSSPTDSAMIQYYQMMVNWYMYTGEYLKAFEFLEKMLPIKQKIHPPDHSTWNYFYQCAGYVYSELGEYSDALAFYTKVLKAEQKEYHSNHPELIQTYVCIGSVYDSMNDYTQALLFYKKALAIEQSTFSPGHEDIGTSYSNVGRVYDHMGEYSLALIYLQAAVDVLEKTLPPFHHSLATSYDDIGKLYYNMGEYSKALVYCEKALEIRENTGVPYHPTIAWFCNNIGMIYEKMRDYRKAFSFYQRAFDIAQERLPISHPDRKLYQDNHRNIKKHLYY